MARYWRHGAVPGVDLLRATYVTHRYARHTHESYTLALIEDGVEEFRYGGSLLRAGRGAVALLNPEMVHTGQAGVPEGWSYRVLYPAVSLVRGVRELTGSTGSPFFTRSWTTRAAPGWSGGYPAAEHGARWPPPAAAHRPGKPARARLGWPPVRPREPGRGTHRAVVAA
jgi:hypothetical protein